MKNKKLITPESVAAVVYLTLIVCSPCHASLETALQAIQTKVMTILFPCIAAIGIVWAAISLLSGNPNAKQHMLYAMMATAFGFGAQLIVDFMSTTVR